MTFRRQTTDLIRGAPAPTLIEPTSSIARSTATHAPATAKAPVFLPQLPASYEASIGWEAQRAISDECRRMARVCRGFDLRESGGWLLANPSALAAIVHATFPGHDAEHKPSSMRLGGERLETVRSEWPHLAVVGSWHLHPNGDATPSRADREAWASWRELDGVPYHVGLIVTRGRYEDWSDPELTPWITKQHFCEPLALKKH
jgi:proteasome lid subunit RPN8/RPN11